MRSLRESPWAGEALRSILDVVPGLRIVFSSTWRPVEHVNRLYEQWLAHGLPPDIAIDGTPDLRDDPIVARLELRGREIERWLLDHPEVTRWAVLDDDRMSIEPVLGLVGCVFTDPQRGLVSTEAARFQSLLNPARGLRVGGAC